MATARQDLTRREGVQADAEQFRLLVESVKDYAIFLLTPEGRVASWNAGAAAIKGYRSDEIIGQHFSRFYEPESIVRGWPDHELTVAKAEGRFEDEGWRLRKDGTRFWASVVITALYDPTGELRGFAKVTRDLTARRNFEELQRSERRMNEFLAMLAHELRNPLAPMRTALDILARTRDDPKVVGLTLDMFSRQLGHLTHLVDDLLDVARITSGKVALRFEAVDLNDLVRERVMAFQPQFESRGQSLTLSVPDLPTPLQADPTRLSQVVSNLLANAHKFSGKGGRTSVVVRHEMGHAMLEISDDGVGIEPHLLPLIFELFVQGERGLDRPEAGLGLGLTLVKRLVDMHGGTVVATSKGAGQGSTFSIKLPMQLIPARRPLAIASSQSGVRLRVMVVEDNADIANSMALLLGVLGHDAEIARDGVEALNMASTFVPDVVLLDIGLPRMNGYDVARSLRALPTLRRTLLVACTGYGRDDDRERAREAGFDHHATKPVTAETLVEILRKAEARIGDAGVNETQ
jgi:PAS domain S-box-containing protein